MIAPLVPVTLTDTFPRAAPGVAAKVSVPVPELATVAGENDAVTPEGKLELVRLTEPVNPFRLVIVINTSPVHACHKVGLEGVTPIEKSGWAWAEPGQE